ncbi:MAG TPA: DUF3540 domain-containing protein [Byssovorax sp.]|jgi:hypothetical protein
MSTRAESPGHVERCVGEVVRVEGRAIDARVSGEVVEALRALSCLTSPHVGDRVAIAVVDGRAYALHVLTGERRDATIEDEHGDVTLHVGGRLAVAAQDGIELVSAGLARVVTTSLDVRARSASFALDRVRAVATRSTHEVESASIVARSLGWLAERVLRRAREVTREVEHTDELRAERVEIAAKTTVDLHGENTTLVADHLVKADGQKVEIG